MSNKEVYISFNAPINQNTIQALLGALGQQISGGADKINLLISTPGGEVASGITAYNTLRGLPIELVTHNVGMVDSIGTAIYLAGKRRLACPNSRFMFHGVGISLRQAAVLQEKELRERLDSIHSDQGLIANIINERTNVDTKEVKDLFLRADFVNSKDALSKGIAHEIIDVSIPQGVPFLQLVFQK